MFLKLTLSLLACVTALNLPATLPPVNFTMYLVNAQWDGRTVPTEQWALDVTRQDTTDRPGEKQELKFQNLVPMTPGNVSSKQTFTAWEPITRTYYTTASNGDGTTWLWATGIANDVNSSKPLGGPVKFSNPSLISVQCALEIWNNNGVLVLLAIYKEGVILQVDPATGATTVFATIIDSTRVLSTAVEFESQSENLYVITASVQGVPNRQMLTLNLSTRKTSSIALAALRDNDQMTMYPFNMVWLSKLQTLLVFWTGNFDQIIYTEPHSGMTSYAIDNLAYIPSPSGQFEFETDDYLEMDDTWSNSCVDSVKQLVFFQCSDFDPETGFFTTTLCEVPIFDTAKLMDYVNTAIWPMTYGYAGMQCVQVVQ